MEIIIVALILLWLIFAVRSMIKGKSGCCKDCSQCNKNCKK